MDEAEKYQQRLQAIAEKRRAQEEEDRVKRETEEEWLKIAQRKRKSLRDQWLMEPMPSSAEGAGIGTTPWPSTQRTEECTKDRTKEIQEEDDKTANMNDEQVSQTIENEMTSHSENTEDPTQTNPGEEDDNASANFESAETVNTEVVLQNGQLERSVLGVLEIKVERDPKTGATTIKSMAPAPPASVLEATGEAVFDDGRRTVHAVGGAEGNQHSEKELNQILNAITEAGMQTILDGVGISCKEEMEDEKEIKEETRDPEVEQRTEDPQAPTDLMYDRLQAEDKTSETEDRQEEVQGNDKDKGEAEMQEHKEEWEMVNCRPEEGLDPVVLSFLGFTHVPEGSGLGYEDQGVVLKVEQVFIAGEEEPEMGSSEDLSLITVENNTSDPEKSPKSPQRSESQPQAVELGASCTEETCGEVMLQEVGLDKGAGESVELQEMDNVSDIIASEDSTEDPPEAQQSLPHNSDDTQQVLEVAKEVPEDSAGAATSYTEEHSRHPVRTDTEVKGMEEFPKVEIIKHGSNLKDEVFEDVPLDGNKDKTSQTIKQRVTVEQSLVEEPEIQALLSPDVAPSRARGGEKTKRKTGQCCSVM